MRSLRDVCNIWVGSVGLNPYAMSSSVALLQLKITTRASQNEACRMPRGSTS